MGSGSPFLDIIHRLEIWYAGLPEQLVISDFNVYIHKELNIISAVFMLHFLYHSIVCDLTRVSLPGYVFPLSAAFHSSPLEFRRQCQERCRFHADEISRLVHAGFGYGIRAFDDLHSLMATFESTKIQIIHTATATSNSIDIRERTGHNIRLNMRALDILHLQKDKSNPYVSSLSVVDEVKSKMVLTTVTAQSLDTIIGEIRLHQRCGRMASLSKPNVRFSTWPPHHP